MYIGNPGMLLSKAAFPPIFPTGRSVAPGSVMVENTEAQMILRSTTPVENEPHQFMGAEIVLP